METMGSIWMRGLVCSILLLFGTGCFTVDLLSGGGADAALVLLLQVHRSNMQREATT